MLISDITRGGDRPGEVGIEIEVEGEKLPAGPVGWNKVEDGSLRGESGEYVLRRPVAREKVGEYLNRVKVAYDKNGFIHHPSDRQSIHIHINCQTLTVTQVYNFMVLYLMLEEPLVKFCGDARVGNLFCLRSKDAEALLYELEDCSTPDRFRKLDTDELRYSAMNVSSLFKYGSLEFRSMRGTDDMKLIEQWVNILLSIKDAALTYANPADIVDGFSRLGVKQFIEDTLGDNAGVALLYPDIQQVLYQGIRRVQDIAYTGDWKGFNAPYDRHARLRRARRLDGLLEVPQFRVPEIPEEGLARVNAINNLHRQMVEEGGGIWDEDGDMDDDIEEELEGGEEEGNEEGGGFWDEDDNWVED